MSASDRDIAKGGLALSGLALLASLSRCKTTIQQIQSLPGVVQPSMIVRFGNTPLTGIDSGYPYASLYNYETGGGYVYQDAGFITVDKTGYTKVRLLLELWDLSTPLAVGDQVVYESMLITSTGPTFIGAIITIDHSTPPASAFKNVFDTGYVNIASAIVAGDRLAISRLFTISGAPLAHSGQVSMFLA